MSRWRVFYAGDEHGECWEVTAKTASEAILAVGNSQGLVFDELVAQPVAR